MENEKRRVVIYTRVSTEMQEQDGYSLEEQERLCRAAVESKGREWEYVRTYCDAGFSGKTVDRPALQEMLTAVRAGKIDVVMIYKMDRLSRSQRDTLMIIEDYLLPNKVDIVSLKETLDTTTPWGRAMIGILASFNQLDRETIIMRTMMGRKAKAASGGFTGGEVPYGYRLRDKQLVVDADEAAMVREIFRLRREGKSYRAIADHLAGAGMTGRNGKAMYYTTIGSILNHRDLYLGYKVFAGNKYDGKHDAILDETYKEGGNDV